MKDMKKAVAAQLEDLSDVILTLTGCRHFWNQNLRTSTSTKTLGGIRCADFWRISHLLKSTWRT